jgi:hypothetical protein
MKNITRALIIFWAMSLTGTAWAAAAEDQFFAGTEKFAKGAKNVSEVTLDQRTLRMASGFIGKEDNDSEDVKRIMTNLKGVFVRSYEYASDGQYNAADLEEYRKRLDGNGEWAHIVKVRSIDPHGENTDVYMLTANGKTAGIVVIAAEPRELTFVHIDGPINPEDLGKLGGSMGIPRNTTQAKPTKQKKDAKDDKSESERPTAEVVAANTEVAQ